MTSWSLSKHLILYWLLLVVGTFLFAPLNYGGIRQPRLDVFMIVVTSPLVALIFGCPFGLVVKYVLDNDFGSSANRGLRIGTVVGVSLVYTALVAYFAIGSHSDHGHYPDFVSSSQALFFAAPFVTPILGTGIWAAVTTANSAKLV